MSSRGPTGRQRSSWGSLMTTRLTSGAWGASSLSCQADMYCSRCAEEWYQFFSAALQGTHPWKPTRTLACLVQNDSVATLLARLVGILGPIPGWMIRKGRYSHRFFTKSGQLYERITTSTSGSAGGGVPAGASSSGAAGGSERYELLLPKRTSMRHRVPDAAPGLLDFIGYLLCVDPRKRPSAAEALGHPWLQQAYPSLDSM